MAGSFSRSLAWGLGLAVACGGPGPDADDTDSPETDDTDSPETDDTDSPETDDTDADPCAERRGGALISFDVVDESFTAWFTDDVFIETAARHLADGTVQVPNFLEVVQGTDCDPQWRFHVDPAAVEFADVTIELCDGLPSYLDADVDTWIASVGSWCPWAAVVVAVEDRREAGAGARSARPLP